MESYFVDHGAYPAWATGAPGINGVQYDEQDQLLPSFRAAREEDEMITLVTPPSAYIPSYPPDPFSPQKGATYVYFAITTGDQAGWILVSAGLDHDYDIDPARDYSPAVKHPSPRLLHLTYDPTNGTVSNGDIWRVK